MTVIDHYKFIVAKLVGISSKSLDEDDMELFSSNHSFIHDFNCWLEILQNRPEYSILKNSIKEFQMSIVSNSLGMYQQAFTGLRFFLERSLVAILFSANEIELNLWKQGERDTYWSEITDDNNGVFSAKFCRAFFTELKDEIPHFKNITLKVYRECSEYVHGNHQVLQKLPETLEYSKEIFNEWNSKADVVKRVILFTLCLRYLKSMNKEEIKKINSSLSDEFKSIYPIIEKIAEE